ncbi:MAG: tRNA adenosine(34) deaminase TadA [Burkholderiales bacterium]
MTDEQAMSIALGEARAAAAAGEVPVGAVVIRHGLVVGVGRNCSVALHDPTGHAEMMALRAAARHVGNYRLDGCELFVTLEPCAMCAGAMLHSRLTRVVFGAPDPKTGAAGSVINLFSHKRLNHQTECVGGVLAAESADELRSFFRRRRRAQELQTLNEHPLRDDALRTPAACFSELRDFPWMSRYLNDLPSLAGLRLHYLDERPPDSSLTFLCLHGRSTWSYWWHAILQALQAAGHRVVVPDLIGFGMSDKPKKEACHTFDWHRDVLLELVQRLDLRNVVLAVQGTGWHPGLALPFADPDRFRGLLAIEPKTALSNNPGDLAPYPDAGHRAALRGFASLAPVPQDAAAMERFWRHEWQGQAMLIAASRAELFGDAALDAVFRAMPASDPAPLHLAAADSAVAEAAVRYFRR